MRALGPSVENLYVGAGAGAKRAAWPPAAAGCRLRTPTPTVIGKR